MNNFKVSPDLSFENLWQNVEVLPIISPLLEI